MRRRHLLRGLLASAGVAALHVGAQRDIAVAASGETRSQVRLGYVGNPCEAPTFAAPTSSIFAHHGLAARLARYPNESKLIAALGAGSIDAASINLPALLEPLERGLNVRIAAGLHAGCLRVAARDVIESFVFGDLRGKSVATDRLHGPSMNLLWALLRRQGIDPEREISWRVYDQVALEPALYAKEVDAFALADPFAYLLIADKAAEPYIDTADGGFSCGVDAAHGHHCFLALHGGLVANRPKVAAALTRAYLAGAQEVEHYAGAAAVTAVRGGYVDVELRQATGMISSYDWNASSDLVLEEIELTARDFRRAGLLKESTDPYSLASRAFADVFGA